MLKKLLRFILVVLLSLLGSTALSGSFGGAALGTLYSVSGIVFSIGMGLIISFNLGGARERDHVFFIRKNLSQVRKSFIFEFALSTFFYISYPYLPNIEVGHAKFIWSYFSAIFILSSIVYFVKNFIAIQNLKDEIFDKTMR